MKRNDTAPALAVTLTVGGVAVDLSAASSVRFLMSDSTGRVVTDAPATITDPTNGKVSYSWSAADTANAGRFNAEWEVTYVNGTKRTFPVSGFDRIIIDGDIA